MRRHSCPEYEHGLPVFQRSIAIVRNCELVHSGAYAAQKNNVEKKGTGNLKSVLNVATAILVFVLGYAGGRIHEKQDHLKNNACNYAIIDDNNVKNTTFNRNDHDDIDFIDHGSNNISIHHHEDHHDHWDPKWRGRFQGNGLPLDHKPLMSPEKYTLVQDSHPFSFPDLRPLQISPLFWASNGKRVDHGAHLIGLPPRLTDEIRTFTEDIGLFRLFEKMAHGNILEIGETLITGPGDLKEGHTWAINNAGSSNNESASNLHYFDVVDEAGFEQTVNVLKKGMFDEVLHAIADELKPWGYMVAGMGFTVATHSEAARIYRDSPGFGNKLMKLVFPIVLPQNNVAQLYVGNEDYKEVAPMDLEYNQGLLISGDTPHGTADCDYRMDGSMQVFVSISIADIDGDNVKAIAADGTALSPVHGQNDWLMSQRGRFWGGKYGGSFESDRGRQPFDARDNLKSCPQLAQQGLCLKESKSKAEGDLGLLEIRSNCPKSCGIYIDDETYFSKVRPLLQPKSLQHTKVYVSAM